MAKPCPCTSGLPYPDCCRPLHRGEREADAPEVLVRARFAAFALGDAEFLWRTLHPSSAERKHPKEEVVRAIKATSWALKYMRLTILDAKGEHALFLARVFEKGQDRSFVELSTFARDGAALRYLAGAVRAARDIPDIDALSVDSLLATVPKKKE